MLGHIIREILVNLFLDKFKRVKLEFLVRFIASSRLELNPKLTNAKFRLTSTLVILLLGKQRLVNLVFLEISIVLRLLNPM